MQNEVMELSTKASQLSSSQLLLRRTLSEDLARVALVNPLCEQSKPPSLVSRNLTDCDDVTVFGGVTPLPGHNQTHLNSLSSLRPPANLDSPGGLSNEDSLNDSVRIVTFDPENSFGCNVSYIPGLENPTQNSFEEIVIDRNDPNCDQIIEEQGLYILSQNFQFEQLDQVGTPPVIRNITYSNILQITGINEDFSYSYYQSRGGNESSDFKFFRKFIQSSWRTRRHGIQRWSSF
jgi:hypothetical protein